MKDLTPKSRIGFPSDFGDAFIRRDFFLRYQPIVALDSAEPLAAEAIPQWHHPQEGEISSSRVRSIAKECGLLVEFDSWTVGEACLQWRQWQREDAERAPGNINVNLSCVYAQCENEILHCIDDALAQSGVPAESLALELAEDEVMREPEAARSLMNQLRDRKVRLVLDGFGSGMTSLFCLRRLPFDMVKLDGSLTAELPHSWESRTLIRAIVMVAESAGRQCIAEGIRTPLQAEILRSVGCRFAQGDLFCEPVPGDDLVSQLPEAY